MHIAQAIDPYSDIKILGNHNSATAGFIKITSPLYQYYLF